MTVAAFMDLVLYDPECGYYARAAKRSGRTGDFFTSVDVGSLFGELLAVQVREMAHLLRESRRHESPAAESQRANPESRLAFDLVEAGAGNGRLSADILAALRERDPELYRTTRMHLVEASAAARAAQRATLGNVADRLVWSAAHLPDSFEGVLIANELLDAMPTHQVVMREDGLREMFVGLARPFQGRDFGGPEKPALQTVEGPPSTPALQAYLDRAGVQLEPGFRAEINLRAIDWVREAARRLRRGFMLLIDYGHEARELYSVTHAGGTLTTFRGHRSAGAEAAGEPPWLANPGDQDITAHVDFTSVSAAAEAEGMQTIAFLDQTYFLLGLFETQFTAGADTRANASAPAERGRAKASTERTHALKTLILPGGLGSTMKVLILGKGVGTPTLAGCSFKVRVT